MANTIEVIEGFDEMDATYVALAYACTTPAIRTDGLVEGRCYGITNNQRIEFAVPANTTYTIGWHWRPNGNNNPAISTMVQFMEGATEHVRLACNADNTFTLSRAGSIPAVSSNVGAMLSGVWHWMELSVTISNGAGSWELKYDGTTILGPTGSLDTNNAGAVGTCNVVIFRTHNGGPSWDLDNVYIASGSAGFQGEGRCVTDMATADGTNTSWTASAGSDYQCVDEVPPTGDTDYISSSTAGHIDTFTMATLGITGTIKAVAVRLFARKDDAGARTLATHIRRASTEYDNAATHALSTSYAGYQGIWVTDPNTGVAWVDSDIDGAEFGVKNV